MTAGAPRCRQLVELATDYLESALTRDQMSAVRAHLATCDDCSGFIAQMRVVIGLSRSRFGSVDGDATLPPDRLDSIRESFRLRSASG